MDERKICFIICVNDEMLFDECSLYLKNLHIPAGYKAEIIPVRNAKSMTSGYNLAMKNSNAKYKVYLHQDVLIIEKEFISKILELFRANQNVGMIGVVGNRSIAVDGCPWSDGMHRRVGEIYADLITDRVYSLFAKAEMPYEEVVVVDGLLMATQYDIPWREDLFEGWDFYDCSQSIEFIKAGYQVAVPYMERPWCFHDNDILNMKNYEKWRKVFEKEYRNIYIKWTDKYNEEDKYIQEIEDAGMREKKRVVFQVFFEESSLLDFPYPPVCTEDNTDYICFTDSKKVTSKFWRLVYVEDVRKYTDDYRKNETVEKTLCEYSDIQEIKPQQIIISKIFDRDNNEPFAVEVLPLDKLPKVKFDLNKLVPTKGEDGEYLYKKNPVYTGGKYEGREYVLTIGVPVSNQIETIDRCLSRIKPLLDELDAELVVVDTGSTDGTVEVCEKYGARIVSFPWCDNMSAARNVGIYNARGLWYMSIDDDEWFDDVDPIIKFFKNGTYKNCNAAGYVQKNRLYKTQDIFTENFAIRMAKITPTLHFEGRIHDCLTIEGKVNVCPIHSYANHEGFLRDDADKLIKKYRRNTGNLLYDVYEYPANPRYNFQLGNEMTTVGYHNEALGYFCRGIAIDMEQPDSYFGRQHATSVMATLYHASSERIFSITELLMKKYQYTDVEMAYFNYNMADVALRYNHAPEEILSYYKKYIEYRERYNRNPVNNEMKTFTGLHVCKNLSAITDGYVIAFCACCRMGKDMEASALLKKIKPEEIFNETDFFAEECVLAGEKVFCQVMEMLPILQYEMWMDEFVCAFQRGLQKEGMFELVLERLYLVLQKFSIKGVERFTSALLSRIQDEIQEKLYEAIMQSDYMRFSLQGLCFNEYVLKKKLAGRKDLDNRMDVFFKYVQTTGLFVQKFYSTEVLENDNDISIASDERAAYDIYTALTYLENSDAANAVEKIIGRLRHALARFPGFKSEISLISDSINGNR